jgi:hypothetical protein
MIELSNLDIWKIQNDIKYRNIQFNIGDDVILFKKKPSGYPKALEIGETYKVTEVEIDHIIVRKNNSTPVKCAKKYFLTKSILRDLKISKIFE